MQFKRDVVMKKISLLALVVSLSISSVANAGFVSLDWKADGDSQASLHEETGIEWLKLNNTGFMSISDVKAQLGVGGTFEGWRLPTVSEVAGVNNYIWGTTFGDTELVREDIVSRDAATLYAQYSDVFGVVYKAGNPATYMTKGLFVDPDDGTTRYSGSSYYSSNGRFVKDNYNDTFNSEVSKHATFAVFLVADGGATKTTQENMALTANNPNSTAYVSSATSVPEPTSMAILGLGLLGLGAARMSKKSKV
jgi:hypothetical protein